LNSLVDLKQQIKRLALEKGFQAATIADTDTSCFYPEFAQWISEGNHGEMSYLERNQPLRQNPEMLHPGTCRVISLRYNYLPQNAAFANVLSDSKKANISRYALGRDYHKLMRKKLKQLAKAISEYCEDFDYRVFVDSAPVLETSFADKSGLGWKGKHTLIINKDAGSWFFLGEIFINIPLPIDKPVKNQCGACSACINLCPTDAIIAPYKVDARKCISYLTIENKAAIPIELRGKIGNRIYGCDDCQLACPWNRFSSISEDQDFSPRQHLDDVSLLSLFNWTEEEFNINLQGNPIRRIGFENWQRNIAVALGNGSADKESIDSLQAKIDSSSEMVKEHIQWALAELDKKKNQPPVLQEKTQKLIRTIEKMIPRDA